MNYFLNCEYNMINKRMTELINAVSNGNKRAFSQLVGVSPTVIENIVGTRQGKPGYELLEKILFAIENINIDWLLTGRGSMLRTEVASISLEPTAGVPYYNVDFIGGFGELDNDQTRNPDHNIVFKQYEDATLWCNITGHSMAQKINHGDIIALRECRLEDVLYGEIYAVVMDTLRTVKILRKSQDPNKFRFVPINTAEFDEQEFEKNRIIRIFEVLGSISKFF